MEVKEVLQKQNLEYKLATKDYIIRCLSPEHEDNNPSCHVDKLTGIFHCWSCGFSGSIYEHFELEVPNQVNRKVEFLKQKISKLLWSKPLQMPIDASKIDFDFREISKETLIHFEAFQSDSKDLDMEGRIIFPVRDLNDNIRAFIGRFMYSDLKPKYKYYPHEVELALYPQIPEIESSSIILVEGIFDMLNLYDNGLRNVVVCNGTNMGLVKKRSKRQKNIDKLLPFKYQGVNTLYILFDGDDSGRKAAKGLELYTNEIFNVKVLDLEDGQDPGSLSKKEIIDLKEKLYE